MDSVWLTGDPVGMSDLAVSLRGFADGVAALQSSGDADVAAMVFEGPAGTRFDDGMRGVSRAMNDVAARLHALAGTLDGAATRVAEAQAEQRREEDAAQAKQKARVP